MKHGVLIITLGIFSLFSKSANASNETNFWNWFQKNEQMIFNFENDTERVFDKLSDELAKIDPELTFEFSPIRENGKREFVISAGGIKSSFPAVLNLADSAPELKSWTIVKFRPRRHPLNDLTYGGINVRSEDVYYNVYKDGEKLGIVLFFDNYSEDEHIVYGNLGFLFLDEALGEYDVATRLSFIEFHNKTSQYFENSKPISQLPEQFDDYYAAQSDDK